MKRLLIEIVSSELSDVLVKLDEVARLLRADYSRGDDSDDKGLYEFSLDDVVACSECGRVNGNRVEQVPEKNPPVRAKRKGKR